VANPAAQQHRARLMNEPTEAQASAGAIPVSWASRCRCADGRVEKHLAQVVLDRAMTQFPALLLLAHQRRDPRLKRYAASPARSEATVQDVRMNSLRAPPPRTCSISSRASATAFAAQPPVLGYGRSAIDGLRARDVELGGDRFVRTLGQQMERGALLG